MFSTCCLYPRSPTFHLATSRRDDGQWQIQQSSRHELSRRVVLAEVDISLASLALHPIPEQIKMYQHREGTEHIIPEERQSDQPTWVPILLSIFEAELEEVSGHEREKHPNSDCEFSRPLINSEDNF